MTKSLPNLIVCTVFISALVAPAANLYAQVPSASHLRGALNEVERDDARVLQIISRAENHFKQGKLNLDDNKREQARDEFDRAVDVILESGMDVRSNPRLRDYYLQLVERVYREEVPMQQAQQAGMLLAQNPTSVGGATNVQNQQPAPPSQIGFREQKFEPSPLDELSRLKLTPEEQNVSTEDVAKLEVAKSAVDFGFNTNPLIQQFINYYQGRGRATMISGLRRSGRFMTMARRIFREEGVPEDIAWLGQVESAWRPNAYSHKAAAGMWQFIAGTGAQYGLRQTAWIDERNSLEKATRASARHLKDLARHYNGNWELAMAAYNTGAGKVDREIRRVGVADFWRIYPHIYLETRNYVPNILATILIAKNPAKYGFNVQPEPPLRYDVVKVPSATGLRLIASAADTSVDYLQSINPELRRDMTPPGEMYNVNVPAGKAKQLVAILKRVPLDRRDATRIISVMPGEDLQAVATRTGASVSQLQALNSGVDVKAGAKLVVPGGASTVRNVALVRARPNTPTSAGRSLIKVRAQAGDTITKIAARYNASADEVARLNGVAAQARLPHAQEILVPAGASAAPARPPRRR